MLNCKQVVDLASKSLDSSIPWQKRWQMQWHLFICKICQRYMTQLRFIQKTAKSIDKHCQHISLSKQARQRIQENVKHHKR